MQYKTRIAVLGLGSVGGYFGGLLARHYESSDTIEIIFIARGDNERVLKSKGISVQTPGENFVAKPAITSSDPLEIGAVDYLICCTKTYDLEQSIRQYISCIDQETVLLSLLNGVDFTDRIKQICPENEVLDGCVYVISSLAEPGVIKKTSGVGKIFFGTMGEKTSRQILLEKILVEAGIDATRPKDIKSVVWGKYMMISSMATLTSFLKISLGAILADSDKRELLLMLMHELNAVAFANGIRLPGSIVQQVLDTMSALPYETTSSMYRDFQKGGATELESLTGYVVKLGQLLKVPTPAYAMMYEKLK